MIAAMDYVKPLTRFDLVEPTTHTHSEYYRYEIEKAERNVDSAVNRQVKTGFQTISVIRNQDPKNLLVEQAKEWEADCIFVGAKGKSRVQRLLTRTTSLDW